MMSKAFFKVVAVLFALGISGCGWGTKYSATPRRDTLYRPSHAACSWNDHRAYQHLYEYGTVRERGSQWRSH